MKKFLTFIFISISFFSCKNSFDLFNDVMKNDKKGLDAFIGVDGAPNYNTILPVNISVSKNLYQNYIEVKWEDTRKDIIYNIYRVEAEKEIGSFNRIIGFRQSENFKWKKIATVSNEKFYRDADINLLTGFYYSVKCSDEKYESKFSNIELGWNFADVKNIDATIKDSVDYISVKWDNLPFALKYGIYRGEAPLKDINGDDLNPTEPLEIGGSRYKKIGESLISSYEDLSAKLEGPIKNTLYFYKIEGHYANFISDYNKSACGRGEVLAPGSVLPPKNIVSSRGLGEKIVITWDKVSGAKEYIIYRSDVINVNGENLTQIAKVTENSFIDSNNLLQDRHYWYAVSSINFNGDAGKISLAENNSTGVDDDGCSYKNEGYILSPPKPVINYIKNKDTSKSGIAVVTWQKVPAAKKYKISKDKISWHDVENLEWTDTTSFLADSYSVKSINVDVNNIFYESAIIDVSEKIDYFYFGSKYLYEGSNNDLKGIIEFSWNEFLKSKFTKVKIFRNNIFKNDNIELGEVDVNDTKFVDRNFLELLYTDLDINLPKINVKENIDHNIMIENALSNRYLFEFSKDGETYIVCGIGLRMFTAKELFMLFKLVDHTSTNHITNQISAIHGDPNKLGGSLLGNWFPTQKETDQGFFAGTVEFDPYQPPSVANQFALIAFRFNNISDYPGIYMNGDYFIWKDKTTGKINNSAQSQNPTVNMTFADKIVISLEDRVDIDRHTSAVLGGSSKINVKFNGATIIDYTFAGAEMLAFFKSGAPIEISSSNCPGGRNFTRAGRKSIGHYTNPGCAWVDPEDCGYKAKLQEHDSARALAITDR